MVIEVFADNLKRTDISSNLYRSARSIVIQDGKIMFLYTNKFNFYMLPGGGIEENEKPEECVIRELKEETGFLGKVIRKTLIIKEYYLDSTWETHYFLVDLESLKPESVNYTKEEQDLQLELRWIKPDEALMLLDSYDSSYYKANNIMSREFLAIINSI